LYVELSISQSPPIGSFTSESFGEFVGSSQAQFEAGSMIGEMVRSHNASSAISSSACQDHNPGLSPVPTKAFQSHLCQVAAGILHHLEKMWARLFHRDSIDLSHLIGRDGRDFYASRSEETH
jgi:hypothetical protein